MKTIRIITFILIIINLIMSISYKNYYASIAWFVAAILAASYYLELHFNKK